ncbi:MAG: metal ABC transporter ATP-binding protein [Moraxellaceae bacterium]|nr:metal ABC transporter ATP-binding protein [Moraxellaceae bacterium]
MNNKPLLQLKSVSFAIDKNTKLVSDIDLTIAPNDMISIIGRNGAGKSTLVKLMLGLLTPTTGEIIRAKKLVIGYVPQKFSIPNILPLRVIDLLNQATQGRITTNEKEQLFKQLSLKKLLNKQLINLSGGETQRVLLARALLEKPNLLILDEPMQGLDPETEEFLYRFIDNLPSFLQCAMLVVSHDLHWVMKGSRHVICLNKHICCQGQPIDIQDKDEFQQLFGLPYATALKEHKFERPYIHHHNHCQHG